MKKYLRKIYPDIVVNLDARRTGQYGYCDFQIQDIFPDRGELIVDPVLCVNLELGSFKIRRQGWLRAMPPRTCFGAYEWAFLRLETHTIV